MPLPTSVSVNFFRYPRSLSIRLQLLLIYGILFAILSVSTCYFVYSDLQTANQHQSDTIGQLLSNQTAKVATDMLVTGDRLSITVLLNELTQNPYVAKTDIYSIDDREIASAQSQDMITPGKVYSSPIHYQDAIAGYVHLQLDQKLLTQHPHNALTIIIIVSIILLIGGLVLIHFYATTLRKQITLTERQLHSILETENHPWAEKNELSRLASYIERQLTAKNTRMNKPELEKEEDEVSAILCVRDKNQGRLRQLMAPRDLMEIIDAHITAIEMAATEYNGKVSYTPEGSCYIRFSSNDSENFAIDALSCAWLIESLNRVIDEHYVAVLEVGLGLSLSDGVHDFPNDNHPLKSDSAAGNALMLASLAKENSLCLLGEQLSWLPGDIVEVQALQSSKGILTIVALKEELAENIQEQAYILSGELEMK